MTIKPRPDRPFGVYIHFPYCLHRCPYCDFKLRATHKIPHEAYADAVLAELDARHHRFEGRALVSIYFGGGTPGLWAPEQIGRIIDAIRSRWPLLADPADVVLARGEDPVEVTVEINPRSAPAEQLALLRAVGVNRLSVGVQSFGGAQLGALGRDHGAEEARRALEAAGEGGWDRLSLDLLFGGPGCTAQSLRSDVAQVGRFAQVDHVSAYSLIVEPRTRFGKLSALGRLSVSDDAAVVEMMGICASGLAKAGLRRYEISAYARPGREARHNSMYWTGCEYMGLGVGAHEFVLTDEGQAVRREGAARDKDYLRDPVGSASGEEVVEAEVHLAERVYLGLRTIYGVSEAALERAFGASLMGPMRAKLLRFEAEGYVSRAEGVAGGPGYLWPREARWVPTERAMLFADDLAVEVLP